MNALGMFALWMIANPPSAAPAVASQRISVQDAIERATQFHPAVRMARAKADVAAAAAHAKRGRMLPSVHLSDSQGWYRSSVNVAPTLIPGLNPGLFKAFPDDLSDNIFSVAAAQPLLGLLHISQEYMADCDQADAGEHDVHASTATVKANVKIGFLRLFEAKAVGDTAAASQQDLEEQVAVAQKKVAAGILTTADVLRLQVAAANAKQQVIASRGQQAAMRASLLEMLGLGDDDGSVEFVEPTDLQQVNAPAALRQVRQEALDHRPELASAQLQAQAASHRATGKTLALLPDVNVQAAWMQIRADPFNSPTSKGSLTADMASVGFSASWAVWEWGASWYERDQAEAQANAAHAQYEEAQEQVGAEVAARHADVVAAISNVDVASVQVQSAEEAYRVMQALSSAGSATTTDLLDAQAALTSAKMSLVRAHYEAAVASVALERAVGK